jgi:DNA-binding transcriptional LysR family regulator
VALKLDELEDVATALWRQIGRKPQLAVRTASVEAMRSLVATGAGLAIMPDVLYRPWSLEGDRLEVLPLQETRRRWRSGWCGGAACRFLTTRITSLPGQRVQSQPQTDLLLISV